MAVEFLASILDAGRLNALDGKDTRTVCMGFLLIFPISVKLRSRRRVFEIGFKHIFDTQPRYWPL